jgi:hypothetical protein
MKSVVCAKTELAKGFTVAHYKAAVVHEDRVLIARAIRQRFAERYLEPTTTNGIHGFTKMAVSCLMIEALQSFRDGLRNTKGRSEATVVKFLKESAGFGVFDSFEKRFYSDIRCGILHQAEAQAGWRIRRRGPLFDPATRTINATRFIKALSDELNMYCSELTHASWNSSTWKNARNKMDAICDNCHPA